MSAERTPAAGDEPVHRAARRLRWFVRSFHDQAARTAAETGVRYEIDDRRLAELFVGWLRAFERQKPGEDADRAAYVGFAAGLMLRTLVDRSPARARAVPDGKSADHPAYYWPEGYLYVAYCLNVRGLVMEHDFHESQRDVPELTELGVWWSFRENVGQDPDTAIGFLDMFAGDEPDWTMPGIFRPGRVRSRAARFFREVPGAPGSREIPVAGGGSDEG